MKTENAMKHGSEHGRAKVRTRCPHCGEPHTVDASQSRVKCPYCKKAYQA